MKKITLFINSLTSGGAEKVLSVLITELVAQKFNVELLCIEKDMTQSIPKEVKVIYLSKLTKYDSNIKKFLYLPYLALKLKRDIQKNNIKLIQSHIYRANFINLLAKLFGAKHQAQVVEVTSIGNLMGKALSQKINFFLIKHLYPHADLIIFKAKKMQSEFLKQIPFTGNTIIINNPYNIEQIKKLSSLTINDFTFDKEKKYLLSMGRLNFAKRFDMLIYALNSLEEHVELIIIGEGEEEDNLKRLIQEQNLSSRVHLLGKESNPFSYVKQADIFVLASEGEGFPNVLVEAMICRTAVISTDCISGPREILAPNTDIDYQLSNSIEKAQNGILYPVNNQKLLIDSINLLLNDQTLRNSYESIGEEASKAYALEKIIEQYKEVLCVV